MTNLNGSEFDQLFEKLKPDDNGVITYEQFISIGDRSEDATDKTFINSIKPALDGAIHYLQLRDGAVDSDEWKQKKMDYETFLRLLHPNYSDEINTLQFIGSARHVNNFFDKNLSFDTRMDNLVRSGGGGDGDKSSFLGLLADYVQQNKSYVHVESLKSKEKR